MPNGLHRQTHTYQCWSSLCMERWHRLHAQTDSTCPVQYKFSALTNGSQESLEILNNSTYFLMTIHLPCLSIFSVTHPQPSFAAFFPALSNLFWRGCLINKQYCVSCKPVCYDIMWYDMIGDIFYINISNYKSLTTIKSKVNLYIQHILG